MSNDDTFENSLLNLYSSNPSNHEKNNESSPKNKMKEHVFWEYVRNLIPLLSITGLPPAQEAIKRESGDNYYCPF